MQLIPDKLQNISCLKKTSLLLLLIAICSMQPCVAANNSDLNSAANILRKTQGLSLEQTAATLRTCLQSQPDATTTHYLLGLALLDKLERQFPLTRPQPAPQPPPPPKPPPDMPDIKKLLPPSHPPAPAQNMPAELVAQTRECCVSLAASPSWLCRLAAADIIAWTAWTNLPQTAAALLKDELWPVRERAIRAMGFLPSTANIELLSKMAAQTAPANWRERVEIAKALGEAGAAEKLLPMLEDPEAEVRLAASYQFMRNNLLHPVYEKNLRKALDKEKNAKVRAELKNVLALLISMHPAPKP